MHETFTFDRFRLDTRHACLYCDAAVSPLTRTEYKLLLTLLQHRGAPIPREELQKAVWGGLAVSDNNLVQHIRSLRSKLAAADPAGPPYIQTLPGVGYYFRANSASSTANTDTAQPESAEPAPPDNATIAPSQTATTEEVQNSSVENGARPHRLRPHRLRPDRLRRLAFKLALPVAAVVLVVIAIYFVEVRANSRTRSAEFLVAPTAWRGPRIVRTLPTGTAPVSRLALNPDQRILYAASFSAGLVQILQTDTGATIRSLPIPKPSALVLSPDGSKLYIASQVKDVTVLDTRTGQATQLSVSNGPVEELALAPDGKRLYLAMGFLGLRVLDVPSGAVSIISKTAYARSVVLSPDGSKLFVSYQAGGPGGRRGHDAIGIFDAKSLRFLGSADGFANVGECLTASNDGSQIWENGGDACENPAYDHIGCPAAPGSILNVIRASDRKLIKQIAFPGSRIHCPSFTPAGAVVVTSSDSILFLDPEQYRVVGSIPVDSDGRLVVDKDARFGYLPVRGGTEIAVLKLTEDVRAITLDDGSNRQSGLLPVALLSTSDFETKLIDPATLRFAGKPVARSGTGLPMAALDHVVGFEGLHLVVKLQQSDVAGHSSIQFRGKTYAGVVVHGTVDIPN